MDMNELKQSAEIRVIGANLKSLGEELRSGKMDRKLASELANIYGKELKAQQLELVERALEKDLLRILPPQSTAPQLPE